MDEFYTRLYAKADTLFTTLTPVAFVLIVFSLWSNISGGNRSATMYLRSDGFTRRGLYRYRCASS